MGRGGQRREGEGPPAKADGTQSSESFGIQNGNRSWGQPGSKQQCEGRGGTHSAGAQGADPTAGDRDAESANRWMRRRCGHYAEESGRTAHDLIIFSNDLDAVEVDRLYRLLPGPERQRVIRQRAVIRIQDQGGIMAQTTRFTHKTRSKVPVHSCLASDQMQHSDSVRYKPSRYQVDYI